MDTKDIIELAKFLEKKKEIEAELNELKLEQASIKQNILVLKKAREEEDKKLENERLSRNEEIKGIEERLEKLKNERAKIISFLSEEKEKLEELRNKTKEEGVTLELNKKELESKLSKLNSQSEDINLKKEILSKIRELIKQL